VDREDGPGRDIGDGKNTLGKGKGKGKGKEPATVKESRF
jgi:hypothetical protein